VLSSPVSPPSPPADDPLDAETIERDLRAIEKRLGKLIDALVDTRRRVRRARSRIAE
jgi:hypothetical protein